MSETVFRVPEAFARTIVAVYGEVGSAWLDQLPGLLAECARRWSLTIEPPFALSYNYVAPAIRADGMPVVVKAGVPERERTEETAALRVMDGRGIARLLDADPEQGVLLLERLLPGASLLDTWSEAADAAATSAMAGVMRQVWRPAPPGHSFRSVRDWAAGLEKLRRRFDGGTGPLPVALVEAAEARFADLLDSLTENTLLHGDLHHGNVLAAERAPWLAIDPKGVVGEPAYEVGALLRNPLPEALAVADPARLMRRRVDQLADELGFDRERIRSWGMAQAVLSAWWSLEDHDAGWEPAIACAEILAPLSL